MSAVTVVILFAFVSDVDFERDRTSRPIAAEFSVQQLSDFDFDQMAGTAADVPARFRNLDGKRVVVVGRMWAPHANGAGIDFFQLVPPHVSEFRLPLAQEFISCRPRGSIFYSDQDVRVAGILHIEVVHDEVTGVIRSVFSLDVDQLTPLNDSPPTVASDQHASLWSIY